MMSALKEGAPVHSEAKRRGRSVLGKPKTALPSGGKKQIWRKISVAESANIFLFAGKINYTRRAEINKFGQSL